MTKKELFEELKVDFLGVRDHIVEALEDYDGFDWYNYEKYFNSDLTTLLNLVQFSLQVIEERIDELTIDDEISK